MHRKIVYSVALFAAMACAAGPPPGAITVERRPPSPRAEVVVGAPRPGYVWIGGYWRWHRNDYQWVPGHWAPVRQGYQRWVPGRWERSRNRWYWVDGHWSR